MPKASLPLVKTRVLLADDHSGLLDQIRLELGEAFEIVGAVGNGRDAVDAVLHLKPDVLVTDISMPILDGLQVAWHLLLAHSQTRIVFLTVHSDQDFVTAALSAGAYGYVTKPRLATDLVPAIRAALEGQIFVSGGRRTNLQ